MNSEMNLEMNSEVKPGNREDLEIEDLEIEDNDAIHDAIHDAISHSLQQEEGGESQLDNDAIHDAIHPHRRLQGEEEDTSQPAQQPRAAVGLISVTLVLFLWDPFFRFGAYGVFPWGPLFTLGFMTTALLVANIIQRKWLLDDKRATGEDGREREEARVAHGVHYRGALYCR